MNFSQDHSLEFPSCMAPRHVLSGLIRQTHCVIILSYEALLLFFKNYNSQHSRKLPDVWAVGLTGYPTVLQQEEGRNHRNQVCGSLGDRAAEILH